MFQETKNLLRQATLENDSKKLSKILRTNLYLKNKLNRERESNLSDWACKSGNPELAKRVIEKGINVNKIRSYREGEGLCRVFGDMLTEEEGILRPIYWAIYSGNVKTVELLIKKGANLCLENSKIKIVGQSTCNTYKEYYRVVGVSCKFLNKAIRDNKPEDEIKARANIVDLIIKNIDLNRVGKELLDAMYACVAYGYVHVIPQLKEKLAELAPDLLQDYFIKILAYALQGNANNKQEVIKLLLALEIPIDKSELLNYRDGSNNDEPNNDKPNNNVVHLAAQGSGVSLLQHMEDVLQVDISSLAAEKNKKELLPLDIAIQAYDQECIDFLSRFVGEQAQEKILEQFEILFPNPSNYPQDAKEYVKNCKKHWDILEKAIALFNTIEQNKGFTLEEESLEKLIQQTQGLIDCLTAPSKSHPLGKTYAYVFRILNNALPQLKSKKSTEAEGALQEIEEIVRVYFIRYRKEQKILALKDIKNLQNAIQKIESTLEEDALNRIKNRFKELIKMDTDDNDLLPKDTEKYNETCDKNLKQAYSDVLCDKELIQAFRLLQRLYN